MTCTLDQKWVFSFRALLHFYRDLGYLIKSACAAKTSKSQQNINVYISQLLKLSCGLSWLSLPLLRADTVMVYWTPATTDYMMLCQLVYVVSHCNCSLHQKYSWGCNESMRALMAQARVPEMWESNCLSVTWKCPCPLSVSCSVHWSTMAWIWSSAIPNIEKASKFQFKVWLQ